jgi:hypothetical protein
MVLALTYPTGTLFAALSTGCGAVYGVSEITDTVMDNHTRTASWFESNYLSYLKLINRSWQYQSFTASLGAHGDEEQEYCDVPLVKDDEGIFNILSQLLKGNIAATSYAKLVKRDFIERLHYWNRNDCTLDNEVVESMNRFGNVTAALGVDMADGAHNLEFGVWLQIFLKSGFGPAITIFSGDDGYGNRPLSKSLTSLASVCLLKDHEALNRRHLVINSKGSTFELSPQQDKQEKSDIAPIFMDDDKVRGFFEDPSEYSKPWIPMNVNNRQARTVPLGPLILNADEQLRQNTNETDFINTNETDQRGRKRKVDGEAEEHGDTPNAKKVRKGSTTPACGEKVSSAPHSEADDVTESAEGEEANPSGEGAEAMLSEMDACGTGKQSESKPKQSAVEADVGAVQHVDKKPKKDK